VGLGFGSGLGFWEWAVGRSLIEGLDPEALRGHMSKDIGRLVLDDFRRGGVKKLGWEPLRCFVSKDIGRPGRLSPADLRFEYGRMVLEWILGM
jgi:hypothetical protein